MLVGHYGVALALKKNNKNLNLGWIFLAAMLPDILLGIFVLLGIEKIHIPINYSKLHYLLFDFPFSHGLTSSIIVMAVIYVLAKYLLPKHFSNKSKIAITLAIAFISHFLLDVIVNIPEMPLFGSNSLKIGLGLWNALTIALVLETSIAIIGLVIYLRESKSMKSRIGIPIIIALLTLFTAGQAFSPTPTKELLNIIAIQWIISGIFLSALAFWLDYDKKSKNLLKGMRISKADNRIIK